MLFQIELQTGKTETDELVLVVGSKYFIHQRVFRRLNRPWQGWTNYIYLLRRCSNSFLSFQSVVVLVLPTRTNWDSFYTSFFEVSRKGQWTYGRNIFRIFFFPFASADCDKDDKSKMAQHLICWRASCPAGMIAEFSAERSFLKHFF